MGDLARYVNLTIRLKEGDDLHQHIIDKIEHEQARNPRLTNSSILLMALMLWADLPDMPEPDNEYEQVEFLAKAMQQKTPAVKELESLGTRLERIESMIERIAQNGLRVSTEDITSIKQDTDESRNVVNKMLERRSRRAVDE